MNDSMPAARVMLAVLIVGVSTCSSLAQPIPSEQVAELVRSALTVPTDYQTSFTMTTSDLVRRGTGEPTPDQWRQRQSIRSVYSGDRYRHEVLTDVPGQPTIGPAVTFWDGRALMTKVRRPEGVIIKGVPPAAVFSGPGSAFDLVVGRFPIEADLFGAIAKGALISQSRDGSRLTHRVKAPWSDGVEIEVVIDLDDGRVHEMALDMNAESGRASRNRLIIDSYRDYGGIVLPERAREVGASIGGQEPRDQWFDAVAYYERNEVTVLSTPADEAFFTVDYVPGLNVVDQRLNLSFRVGESQFALDGVLYETSEPLLTHPGLDLTALLERSRPVKRPDDRVGSGEPATERSEYATTGRRRFILLAAGGAIASFLAVLVVRAWATRRNNKERES